MPTLTTEAIFETALVQSLLKGGYAAGEATAYVPDLGLFRTDVIAFLQNTQPRRWAKLAGIHGEQTENRVLQRLYKELDLRGALDVIRKGIVDHGVRLRMAFFRPASGLNPDALALYEANDLKVYRQVHYSNKHPRRSVDVVLALNGLPVATLELKNEFTGQGSGHALRQYAASRDPREKLFTFKKRTLVHFAVDQRAVFMTTKLAGERTYWLPFNRGHDNGAGNPPAKEDYRTAYLWEEILQRDSWLEILQRFVHLETEDIRGEGRTYRKEKMIFPRYHQLDVVRRLTADVLRRGVGHNYLVQHSAGSGKSNSIAWLAYRLSSLHNAADERAFDSVIVVTDRRVLDQQLQDTIYQFEHKRGVVVRVDRDSQQLAEAITLGANIIITTLQKFPFALEHVAALPARKYAVIIDEAHSSQGGEASKALNAVLGVPERETTRPGATAGMVVEEPYPTYGRGTDNEVTLSQDVVNAYIERSAAARGPQSNVSFFAFTATPKYKTLEVFGDRDAEDRPRPFHLYSMRQAIEEGFILDVLENYTTYRLYFRLTKAIDEDPRLDKRRAARAARKYLTMHPHNVSQKTEIIIEHFREVVAHRIGGRAKAMVVCESRAQAKRYFSGFRDYIKHKGYGKELKVLVAFSGKLPSEDFPDGVTEAQLNGIKESELPRVFGEEDEYRLLIVADKYQTGFDQPLLHTMYVDKRLSGIRAVQTLSRLNRTCPGKDSTFVLDFVNDEQTILAAFQDYYERTTTTEATDVNHLYDTKARLDDAGVYHQEEIDATALVYFDPKVNLHQVRDQRKLYAFTDLAVERYDQLTEEERDEFKSGLRTWTNLYAFLAQIMPFTDTELEKFYAYAKLLQTRLPRRELSDALLLDDELALEYYRLQKIREGNLGLQKGASGELSGTLEAGLKRANGEEVLLSEIVTILNERFGTEFEDADRLFFDSLEAELLEDEKLREQAKANELDTFKYAFNDLFVDKLLDRMEQNQEIFDKIMSDDSFGKLVREYLMKRVHARVNV